MNQITCNRCGAPVTNMSHLGYSQELLLKHPELQNQLHEILCERCNRPQNMQLQPQRQP